MPSDYANDLMARVGLDTTEWKKGITDLNAGIKHIETGFQATAALMDDWSSNSDGLKKRLESLNDILALQKKKLDTLKKAYDEEVKSNGESSKQAKELAKKMYDARNEINRTKTSIDKYSQAEDEATKKAKALIAELKKQGDTLVRTGDKISSVGNKLTVGVTAPIIAAGTAIYKYSSDLTEAENKTEATFGFMSAKVKEWAKNSLDAFGMAKSTAYDAVSLYGDMATSMGIGKSSAADMSMKLVELSADLSSFKNVSLEQSQNALKGIFTGETESLKNLGIVMTETQLKSYAMSKGFEKNYEDLTQAEKVQLRYQYVLEGSSNALGDYGRTSGEAAGQMRKLPEALKELASSFRDNVEPSITPIISSLNGMIVSFGKLGDGTKDTIVKIGLMAAAIGPLLTVTGKTVSGVGKLKTAIANYRSRLLEKTKATVADTAAEISHSKALDKTATSASGAAKGVKGIGTAAGAAVPYISAVVAALALVGLEVNRTLKEADKKIDNFYNDKLEQETENHSNVIKNMESKREAETKHLEKQTNSVNEYYDNEINRLDERLKIQKQAIETEQDLLEEAHKKRISQLEEERDLKLKLINTQEEAATSDIQKEIDELDALTEAEEEAERERENQKKLAELEKAIGFAKTYAEKVDAENEYNAFVLELEQEKVVAAREARKKELQDQIETIRQESENKRSQVNEEYEQAVKLAEDKYTAEKESLDLRLEALDTFIEDETEKLESARAKRIESLENETSKYVSEWQAAYDSRVKAYEDAIADIEKDRDKEKKEKRTVKGFLLEFVSDYSIPGNAKGTDFWRGGLTRINEEGGEILNLPRGTQIIPHDVSMEMARAAVTTNNTTNNSTTNNSYNYGAQQQVTVLKVGERTIAQVITPQVSIGLSDTIYRRRRAGGGNKRV